MNPLSASIRFECYRPTDLDIGPKPVPIIDIRKESIVRAYENVTISESFTFRRRSLCNIADYWLAFRWPHVDAHRFGPEKAEVGNEYSVRQEGCRDDIHPPRRS